MTNESMRLSYRLDLRSLSITLLGSNNKTLTGTVNLSAASDVAKQEAVDDYDDSGAAYYVCAVILVYGLSIVSLIGSLAKKKLKDNKVEQEEVQIDRYLHNVPDLREKSARDNYRQLKRNVIKMVAEKTSPSTSPQASASSSELKKAMKSSNVQSKSSIEQRQPTPRRYKGKGQGRNGTRRPESQSLLSGETNEDFEECPAEHDPRASDKGPYSRSWQHSVPIQRLPMTHEELIHDEEEKITVVTSDPSDQTDPPVESILMPSASDAKPRFRWSLGEDGNIWIMQVNAHGESMRAEPPQVDSLPPPPSPGYLRATEQLNNNPGPTTFGVESATDDRLACPVSGADNCSPLLPHQRPIHSAGIHQPRHPQRSRDTDHHQSRPMNDSGLSVRAMPSARLSPAPHHSHRRPASPRDDVPPSRSPSPRRPDGEELMQVTCV